MAVLFLIIIIGTIILAGKMPANDPGSVFLVLLLGFWLLSLVSSCAA